MSSNFVYPEHCPVAADLRQALADGVGDMEAEDIKALLIYAAAGTTARVSEIHSCIDEGRIDDAGQRMT